jgi:F0F1-type ATP synthase membrane subunit b/b'
MKIQLHRDDKNLDESKTLDSFKDPQGDEIKKYLWWSITCTIILGLTMIACESGYVDSQNNIRFLVSFGSGVLIAGGSLLTGGILGFIFGIPSVLQDANSKLKYNDNLVQISDWLTKIIVGVGLTQLFKIPHFVIQIGEHFKSNFGNDIWARNVAIAIIAYFLLLGFLMIFFWTKTDYSTMMDIMDNNLNRKLKVANKEKEEAQQQTQETAEKLETTEQQLEVANMEKDKAQQQKMQVVSAVTKEVTRERINQSEIASDNSKLGELKDAVGNVNTQKELEKLKTLVTEVLSYKPVKVSDDKQKNRWGGLSENRGKKISAEVKKNNWQNLFDVIITVSNADNTPLINPVALFIHESYEFPDDVVYLTPENGIAHISILAYEAFTIGALFADGTELELDLQKQTGYPPDFYYEDKQDDLP